MSTTLSNLGPQLGQAGGGYVQGTQLRTQEDTSRQMIALRAAEEGRAKEQHRLSIQQLGLQIQSEQQAIAHASKMFPMQEGQLQRSTRPVGGDTLAGLQQIPGVPQMGGDILPAEAFDIAQMGAQGYRAEQANNLGWGRVNASETAPEKPLDSLKVLENTVRQQRSDLIKLRNDLTGGRVDKTKAAATEALIRRIQFELLPKAEKAVQQFRAQHPELGAPQTSFNELDQDE